MKKIPMKAKFQFFRAERQEKIPLYSAILIFGTGILVLECAYLFTERLFLLAQTAFLARFFAFAGAGIHLTLLRVFHRKKDRAAAEFDLIHHGKGRCESAFELEKKFSPLKEAQRADAERFYAGIPPSRWKIKGPILYGTASALFLLLFAGAGLLEIHREKTERVKSFTRNSEHFRKQAKLLEERLKRERARLSIANLSPDGTTAKPLEEIEWSGTGDSPHGFKNIAIRASVNGVFRKEFSPEEAPEEKGRISFGGMLALDELDVKPFDLVALHLTGTAKVGGRRKVVLSEPVFLEIRPFRDDFHTMSKAEKRNAFTAENLEKLEFLYGILAIQLRLNKSAFALKILRLQKDAAISEKEYAKAEKALLSKQKKAADSLEDFLSAPRARTLPADAVNHLELSLEEMRKSVSLIEKGKI